MSSVVYGDCSSINSTYSMNCWDAESKNSSDKWHTSVTYDLNSSVNMTVDEGVPSFNTSGSGGTYSFCFNDGPFGRTNDIEMYGSANQSNRTGALSFWFKPRNFTNDQVLVEFRNDQPVIKFGTDDYDITFSAYDGGTTSISTASDNFTESSWYHVVATWEGTEGGGSGNIMLYVNGSFVANSNAADFVSFDYNNSNYRRYPFQIGSASAPLDSAAFEQNFTGCIDEVMFFNKTITAQEASNLYNYGDIGGDIDYIDPIINWAYPTTLYPTIPANGSIMVRVSVTDDTKNDTSFYLYNSTKHLISNVTFSLGNIGNDSFDYTFSGLNDSIYYVNATHRDSYNNNGTSPLLTYTINYIDNCSTAGMRTLNISLVNVSNDNYVTGTAGFLFTYNLSDINNHSILKNYSSSMSHGNFSFCIFPNETSFSSDIAIDYTVGANSYTYFTYQLGLTNTTQNINLYTQDGTTIVTFRVTDYDEGAVANAYIKILEWDVGENSFKTVEILKTDSQGYALGNVILYTRWYKFVIDYEGTTYLVTEAEKLFDTTRNFRISFASNWYDSYEITQGIGTKLSFNNVTNNFKYEWAIASGAARMGCLRVTKRNTTRDEVMVDNCTTSTAGERIYNVADPTGTYSAIGYLTINSRTREIITDTLDWIFSSTWKMYDTTGGKQPGILMTFMIVGSMGLIGIFSPVASIVLLLVGIIAASLLGLYKITFGAIIVIIVVGGLLIYKLNR